MILKSFLIEPDVRQEGENRIQSKIEIDKIKITESPPKVVKNVFSNEEIEEFLKLYKELPTTVHNKKQNVIKKRWLQGYNERLEKLFFDRLKKEIAKTVGGADVHKRKVG